MIAVDTDILVYAHRAEVEQNEAAYRVLADLADGRERWALPWPVVAEFFCVVTHPKIFAVPTPPTDALDQVQAWIDAGPVLLSETPRTWDHLRDCVTAAERRGPQAHDARIAAICLDHEVRELWTADRDHTRFPKLRTRNPLRDAA